MKAEDFCSLLPNQPPRPIRDWMLKKGKAEMKTPITVFRAETVDFMELQRTMIYDPAEASAGSRRKRMAFCSCLECGEDYYTQWVPGKGIRILDGEDAQTYPFWDGEDPGGMGNVVELGEFDQFVCPYCGETTTLLHAASLNGGRQRQALMGYVDNIGKYTAIIYFLLRCEITDYCLEYTFIPREAIVIGDRRQLFRYKHTLKNMFRNDSLQPHWRKVTDHRDPYVSLYHDWGSINNRKQGCVICPTVPDLTGTTGDKTAIEQYLSFQWEDLAYIYLRTWQKYPKIELLLRSGLRRLIRGLIEDKSQYSYDNNNQIEELFDFGASKPHDILRMSKPALKAIQKNPSRFTVRACEIWNEYTALSGKLEANEFLQALDVYGESGVYSVLEMMEDDSSLDFPKIDRYLEKHSLRANDVGLLMDVRKMALDLHPEEPLAPRFLWPHNLRQTHDELTALTRWSNDSKKSAELRSGFDRIRKKFGCLEWTDKDLCILLPLSNGDLIREGDILDHCVGTYGESHVKGKCIFFVRHYRRPERPYYTLQMDMTGIPRELQLHGYGNEMHGEHKQCSHKIPQKVRAFVDRWKKEIVMAWFTQNVAKEEVA